VEEVEVQRWVADTRGTYWVASSYGMREPSKSPRELIVEALEAEEHMESEEEAKRN
jgi:hypothetical protein